MTEICVMFFRDYEKALLLALTGIFLSVNKTPNSLCSV